MDRDITDSLKQSGILSFLDCSFADFLNRRTGRDDAAVWAAAALVSHSTGQGHVCLDVPALAGKPLPPAQQDLPLPAYPDLVTWRALLLAHPAVGRPGVSRPLILDDHDRLYLHRYWEYEQSLARRIQEEAQAALAPVDESILAAGLNRLFGDNTEDEIDWQKVAACTAVLKRFCIITGGPGTGKTTTVARVLALLLEQPSFQTLRVALAAPTGKAAARLEEAIGKARESLASDDAVPEAIPGEASTLHRLLGSIPGSPYFRHDANRPLPVDVVVVDEASMVDLALMAKLVAALPSGARLVLLGDKNQLASVQAGAVLGDLCGSDSLPGFSPPFSSRIRQLTGTDVAGYCPGAAGPPIRDCIVELRKSHRFGTASGIGTLAGAINEGDSALALELLQSGRFPNVQWRSLPVADQLRGALRSDLQEGFYPFLTAGSLAAMFHTFGRFRVLCALRQGPYGSIALNTLVEQVLRETGLIQRGMWYEGRPIMVTMNDYNLKLYNGDIGIVGPEAWAENETRTPSRQDLRAHFLSAAGQARWLALPRLPAHETAYALSVHKSQGSEFDFVHLILPERDAPVLTRELLYTAVTRAREGVVIWGRKDIFARAVTRRVRRSSGLRDALWGAHRDAIDSSS
jgi:exodeoxyribonuclease V alpha subunit